MKPDWEITTDREVRIDVRIRRPLSLKNCQPLPLKRCFRMQVRGADVWISSIQFGNYA